MTRLATAGRCTWAGCGADDRCAWGGLIGAVRGSIARSGARVSYDGGRLVRSSIPRPLRRARGPPITLDSGNASGAGAVCARPADVTGPAAGLAPQRPVGSTSGGGTPSCRLRGGCGGAWTVADRTGNEPSGMTMVVGGRVARRSPVGVRGVATACPGRLDQSSSLYISTPCATTGGAAAQVAAVSTSIPSLRASVGTKPRCMP